MRSQRHQPSEPIPDQPDRRASWRPGIASRSRDDGQRLALTRADAYRGLPTALPTIDAVCNALHATARRHPPGRMAIETLEILLRLLPRHCWGQQPGPARDQRHPRQPPRILRSGRPNATSGRCTSTASSPSTGDAATPACAGTSTPRHERLQSPTRHRPEPYHGLRARAAESARSPTGLGRLPRPGRARRPMPSPRHAARCSPPAPRCRLATAPCSASSSTTRPRAPPPAPAQPACPLDAGDDPRAHA